jgi:hypothetical protein
VRRAYRRGVSPKSQLHRPEKKRLYRGELKRWRGSFRREGRGQVRVEEAATCAHLVRVIDGWRCEVIYRCTQVPVGVSSQCMVGWQSHGTPILRGATHLVGVVDRRGCGALVLNQRCKPSPLVCVLSVVGWQPHAWRCVTRRTSFASSTGGGAAPSSLTKGAKGTSASAARLCQIGEYRQGAQQQCPSCGRHRPTEREEGLHITAGAQGYDEWAAGERSGGSWRGHDRWAAGRRFGRKRGGCSGVSCGERGGGGDGGGAGGSVGPEVSTAVAVA